MIAALYVISDGPYYRIDDVDMWDKYRDARLYQGPWPVVAHPPCARWGRYWSGGPNPNQKRKKLGDDDGCFYHALRCVRDYGGVLEHPEASHAWRVFGLLSPPRWGGWVNAGDGLGWTCCVEQGHYGHRARKATWLYSVECILPSLRWGKSKANMRLDEGYHSTEERKKKKRMGIISRLSKRQRIETPVAFRDMLLNMARSVETG